MLGSRWKPVISLPEQLTVRFDEELIDAGDAWPWCASKAADLLGSDASQYVNRRLATTLIRYIEAIRALRDSGKPVLAALFFWPDFTVQQGTAEVYVVADDHPHGPITLARAREITGQDAGALGRTETVEARVPAGPAFRAHLFRGGSATRNVREEVCWFIWPTGAHLTVIMTVGWCGHLFSEAGHQIADDMAHQLRLESLD
jgi:hypothetical protein